MYVPSEAEAADPVLFAGNMRAHMVRGRSVHEYLRAAARRCSLHAADTARARGRQLRHAPFLEASDATLADKRAYHRQLLGQVRSPATDKAA